MGLLCYAAKIYRPLKLPYWGLTCSLAALKTDGYLNRFRAVQRQFDAKRPLNTPLTARLPW